MKEKILIYVFWLYKYEKNTTLYACSLVKLMLIAPFGIKLIYNAYLSLSYNNSTLYIELYFDNSSGILMLDWSKINLKIKCIIIIKSYI